MVIRHVGGATVKDPSPEHTHRHSNMVGLHVNCSGTALQVPVRTLLGDVMASVKESNAHAVQLRLRVPNVKELDPAKAIGTAAYVFFGSQKHLDAWRATKTVSADKVYVPCLQLVAVPRDDNGGIGCVPVPAACALGTRCHTREWQPGASR